MHLIALHRTVRVTFHLVNSLIADESLPWRKGNNILSMYMLQIPKLLGHIAYYHVGMRYRLLITLRLLMGIENQQEKCKIRESWSGGY